MAADLSISDATAVEGSDALKFIDRFISEARGGLTTPRQSIFGPDSNGDGATDLYVVSARTHEVLRYDGLTGAFLDAFVTAGSGGLNNPGDLKYGPDGNLYVSSIGPPAAQPGAGAVLRYNGSTGTFIDTVASGLSGPLGLTFGDDGNLYIANQNGDEVLRYGTSGLSVFVTAGSGGLDAPRNAAFGPDGNQDGIRDLYVASSGTEQVLRYDGRTGAFIDSFATTNMGPGPIWLEFGTNGLLYTTVRTAPLVPAETGTR